MNPIINIVAIGVSVFILSIPLINRFVFHTVNVDQIVVAGREGLNRISDLQRQRKLPESRDSAQALIDRFISDSLQFNTYDITDWKQASDVAMGKSGNRWASLITDNLDEEQAAEFNISGDKALPYSAKSTFVSFLNQHVDNPQFFITYQDSIRLDKYPEIAARIKALCEKGIFSQSAGKYAIREKLSLAEENLLKRFNAVLLEKIMFPAFIRKDLNKGKDWASDFIVQTAIYNIGSAYMADFKYEDAINTWNSLIQRYPHTIYAEYLFQLIGQALEREANGSLLEGQVDQANNQFHEAIKYLEKIERNRDVSRQFPKYKYADLTPGTYVNIDQTSKAKARVKRRTQIYTTKQAESELSGKQGDDRSGYVLEDAVKLIGQCYIQLGKTDSARAQFKIILNYFPESDNLDDAQKLIADSYIKDGDMLTAKADSANPQNRARAEENYRLAVKEYLRFINVYPQSDLISRAFIALGDAYNKLDQKQNANAAFASALGRAKEAEEQAKVQLEIGRYYYERKRYPEAIEAFQVILKNFLSTEVAPNAQYMLGDCIEAMGDTAKSIENYKIILEHYRQSSFMANSAYKVGNYYLNRGDYKDAKEAYNQGFVYKPEDNLAPKIKFQMGIVWRKIADQDEGDKSIPLGEAVKQFKEVVDKFPGREEADQAGFQMADCYMMMNNEKAAREIVKKINSRDVVVKALKLFRVGQEENYEDEMKYWGGLVDEAQEDEERASALYEKAQVLADKLSRYDEALEAYNKILTLTTKRSKLTNAKIGIGKVYAAQKKYSEAESTYVSLINDTYISSELRQQLEIQLYDCYFKGGEKDKAYEGFDKFATSYPEHSLSPYAYYRMGTILADKKEFEKASERFQTVLDKYKESDMYDKAVLGVGEQKLNLGKYREGVNYLEAYIKKNPNASTVVNMLMKIGEAYAKNLDAKPDAIKTYETVVVEYANSPFFSFAAYQAGVLYRDQGNEAKALEALSLAKKEDKSVYRAAQAEIGKIYAKTNPEKALENYKQIVAESETPEDSAIATIGIGDVYATIKEWEKAAQQYKQVYEFYHGADTNLIAGALVKQDDALMNSKRYTEVIAVADIMQKTFPEHNLTINTYYFKASALFALEKYSQARAVLEDIIKLNKSEQLSEIAYYQRGDSYYFSKEYKTAIGMYDEYIKKYPKGRFAARALNMQGNCYVSMEQWDKAKAKLQQVVNDYPAFEELCVTKNYLALSLNRLGEWKPRLNTTTRSSRTDPARKKQLISPSREKKIS
jgi:tetratricopeptide (TPR) repeat protein